MLQILAGSKSGASKEKLEKTLGLSHQQMRETTAELADKGFLRHVGDGLYLTTEDGYKFIAASSIAESRPSKRDSILNLAIHFRASLQSSCLSI
jgi:predicted transcriptional regulator